MSIPYLFRCPISLDVFTDPVTLSTGQTYDRPNIEKWLADGNLTCPVTMQRLDDTSLVPNHTLRHIIDQWLLSEPIANSKGQKPTEPIKFSLSTLTHNLQSPDTTLETKFESLRKIKNLSVDSDSCQACLVQLGFFPLLLQLLLQSPSIINSEEIVELALDCILSLLPSSHSDSLNIVKKDSYLTQIVLLLEQGNAKIKTSLCYLIESIATSFATQELCLILGQCHKLLRVLVSLLHENSDAAVRAISGICSLKSNQENVIKEGAIDGLITYLSNSSPPNSSWALATLEVLLGLETGKKAFVKNSNAVKVLVKMVFRVSTYQEGSKHAVGALLAVCSSSAWSRAEAVSAGVVMQLLLLIQSQCSVEAKAKARALLKLLRCMWAKD